MKKYILAMIAVVFLVTALVGCGEEKISNDVISISGYKNLNISDNADDEEVWQALLEKCTVEKYPQEELSARIDELNTQYGYASYYDGKDASEVIEEIHGKTTEELAKEQLTKEYAIALIAEKEGITLTNEEYEEKLNALAKENGMDTAEEYESLFGEDGLYERFIEESVLDFLRGKGGDGQ